VPPRWPDPNHRLVHLDIRVEDVDTAERSVLATGAVRAASPPDTGFRVFTDPAGHPFCLLYGPSPRQDPRMGFRTTR
jgi:hypothetical protein